MVMNTNGNTLPAKTGPVPSMNRVSAGISICGQHERRSPTASATIVPSFMNVLR